MKATHLAMVFVIAALTGCGEADVEHFQPPPEEPEAEDFKLSTGVMPLLSNSTNRCTGCHNATTMASGLDLDQPASLVYEALIQGGLLEQSAYGEDVNLTFPEQSLFVQAGLRNANFAHAGNKFFDDGDYTHLTLLGWVKDGALDN